MTNIWKELSEFNKTVSVNDCIKSLGCSMMALGLIIIPILLGVGLGLDWSFSVKILLFILCFAEVAALSGLLWLNGAETLGNIKTLRQTLK